ncbi:MAG: CNNM domain-containing protein [Pirellulales bacterium]|nr:CNNM domain-containing protein [Pirellulales bacterium]
MFLLQEFAPLFAAMALLIAGSGFFSCSEAALFSLQADDRRALKLGSTPQQVALDLLARPDRLLMAILFWNLIINIVYFALASVISIQLEQQERRAEAGLVALLSLVVIILCSEMVPKTVGVLLPRVVVRWISLPLALAVRVFDPLLPLFSTVNLAVKRLLFPHFQAEPYLVLTDLEQAITVSTADEELAAQERSALQNIVLLSDLRAEELMRPRKQYQSFTPPVSLEDLGGQPTRSGYLLVTESDTDEITGAISLRHLPTVPRNHLEKFAQPVAYVPWCATVASVFDELQSQQREVAAIVNELGETIGIVTLEDLLDDVFEDQTSRSARLLQTSSISPVGDDRWKVTGMTTLRRLGRQFKISLPTTKSTTVAGLVQELLGRLPKVGDMVEWQNFRFHVSEADELGGIIVELRLFESGREEP